MDAVGHEFEQGKLEVACHCFTLYKAFVGIWLLAGVLSLSPCVPFQVVSLFRLVRAFSEHDGFPGKVSQERDGQAETTSPSLESHTVPFSLDLTH